jgi:hypothetical protein
MTGGRIMGLMMKPPDCDLPAVKYEVYDKILDQFRHKICCFSKSDAVYEKEVGFLEVCCWCLASAQEAGLLFLSGTVAVLTICQKLVSVGSTQYIYS